MSGNGGEDNRSGSSSPDHINLTVKFNEGGEVFFRIKHNTQLKKLMIAYCERQALNIKTIAFLYDGRRIQPHQTPDQLGMEDGDEISANEHQNGGGC